MLMPPVSRYMTPQPWTIDREEDLVAALEKMRAHGVRHLPVLEDGDLVGIISDRDIHIMSAMITEEAMVEDAMEDDVLTVHPDEDVGTVAEKMAARKIGSAVVVNRLGQVEGIFTTVDALGAFAEVLRRATA